MPEDPPIMTIDWPEIEGMLTDPDEVLMESSELKRWISVQVIIDVVILGISQPTKQYTLLFHGWVSNSISSLSSNNSILLLA
jgi:hypothetical protein